MPSLNTTYTPANSITIAQMGTYEINYYIYFSISFGTTISSAIRVNEIDIPSSILTRTVATGENAIFSGSTIVILPANAVIDMTISALHANELILGYGTSAYITIKKIN